MILLRQRRVKGQACKRHGRGNQCSHTGIPPMALGKGPTTVHKQGYIPRKSMMPPMHQRRHLGRRIPPMMHRRATMAMMVVTKVVGGGCTEETPIIVGDIPHAQCWGRMDILWVWVVLEAMPPKTEQRCKTCRQCNIDANQIGARRWPPLDALEQEWEGRPPVLGELKSRGTGGR